ncbi:MAG: bifunctional DNA-binding transcriptional regulator/O6-methylguanine-DNA methyltransferase Ada [Caulobacterales bacterium]
MSSMTLKTKTRNAEAERDPRWAIIQAKDAAADGQFVFSVESTGIYCRPSCAARLPNPKNVAFHETPRAAEAAGFRACKRCRPDEAGARHAAVIEDACRFLDEAEAAPNLKTLAARAGLSPHHFHRTFKAALGVAPGAYFQARRAQKVRDGLKKASTVTDAIYEAGFNSSSRFYEKTDSILGMSPCQFRQGGDSVAIRYAVAPSSLGFVLAASTQKGVCAILLGDDPAALVEDLRSRFPKAEIGAGDEAYKTQATDVVALVEEPARATDFPLDIRGTAFQQRVWSALRKIPAGQTASYADIAATIGAPKAMRAVAGACAANPLAVAVPCHRVVRNDGALSGYRWGVERKRALLDREASVKPKR